MISSLKFMPILVASFAMTSSFIYKVLVTDFVLSGFVRDIILFFIIYFVTKTLTQNVARVFKNYWKIL